MSARFGALCALSLLACRAEIPSGVIACEESNDCPTGFACVRDGNDGSFCVTRGAALDDDFDYGRVDQTNACGLVSQEPCVDTCFQSDCCALGAACAEDAACTALYNCMSECGAENDECTEVCISSYPDGFDPVIDIYTCVIDCECSPSSTEPVPDDSACGGFSSTNACSNACIQGECCALGEACEQDPECEALFACFQECGEDTACGSDCLAAHPDGQSELSAFLTCTSECCPSDGAAPP